MDWNKRSSLKESVSSQDESSQMTIKDMVLNRRLKGWDNCKTTRMGMINREKEKGWAGEHIKNESKIHNSRIWGKIILRISNKNIQIRINKSWYFLKDQEEIIGKKFIVIKFFKRCHWGIHPEHRKKIIRYINIERYNMHE